ncbi:MAG: ABC transporter ATP-binding protein [Ktedonobacteraceae bacterium]|nr:ABC transporter ATP-binding protein [Ktedonobacteraceae bacterium]
MSSVQKTVAIEVNNLVKRYPKSPVNAVDTVSFSVQRGEIFGLLGPNGAGKTTTIGILTTSILSTAGHAYVMGVDVATDPIGVKQRISVVPQRSNLDRSLRVKEILTFHAAYHGVPRKERNARANELLTQFGLAERGKEMIGRYSGGMGQRVMVARALMHTPDVLFLDEPTNNLDPQSRLFLWERIQELRNQGITILLTTHDMEEADRLCDRIAIMDSGRILVLDTAAELKKLIPGGTKLEVYARLPEAAVTDGGRADRPSRTPIAEALLALSGVVTAEEVPASGNGQQSDVQVFRFYTEDAGALAVRVTQTIAQMGGDLRDLHLAHPSLEDVFIHLTGRKLRS